MQVVCDRLVALNAAGIVEIHIKQQASIKKPDTRPIKCGTWALVKFGLIDRSAKIAID